jgi:glycosyltransferase involved in cell wall biosynthesis
VKTVVIFDQKVSKTSPAGSCVREEIIALVSHRIDVVLFTSECDLEVSGLTVVPVKLPTRPILFRYLIFQVLAWFRYAMWRSQNPKPLAKQTTQGQFIGAEVCYAHYCHTHYLRSSWEMQTSSGLRRLARYVLHRFNAICEASAFSRAEVIVCPSRGLIEEIKAQFPEFTHKLRTIQNPIDTESFRAAEGQIESAKKALSKGSAQPQLCFVALGDFERKGLGVLLTALALLAPEKRPHLHVVGGGDSEIDEFFRRAKDAGIASQVTFHGMQSDIRPYLWASDVFVLLSTYETFSLVVHQAAAAGLPILSTRVSGVNEMLQHGENGWEVRREPQAVSKILLQISEKRVDLEEMGLRAQSSVAGYARSEFHKKWVDLYEQLFVD